MKSLQTIVVLSCLSAVLFCGCSSRTSTATQAELPASSVQKQQKEAEKICEEIQRFVKDQKPSYYIAATVSNNSANVDWFIFESESERANVSGEPVGYVSVWMRDGKPAYVIWEEGMVSRIGSWRYTEYFFRSNGVLAAIYTQGALRAGEEKWSRKFFFDDNAKPITTENSYEEYSTPAVYERVENLPFYGLLPK